MRRLTPSGSRPTSTPPTVGACRASASAGRTACGSSSTCRRRCCRETRRSLPCARRTETIDGDESAEAAREVVTAIGGSIGHRPSARSAAPRPAGRWRSPACDRAPPGAARPARRGRRCWWRRPAETGRRRPGAPRWRCARPPPRASIAARLDARARASRCGSRARRTRRTPRAALPTARWFAAASAASACTARRRTAASHVDADVPRRLHSRLRGKIRGFGRASSNPPSAVAIVGAAGFGRGLRSPRAADALVERLPLGRDSARAALDQRDEICRRPQPARRARSASSNGGVRTAPTSRAKLAAARRARFAPGCAASAAAPPAPRASARRSAARSPASS